MSSGATVPRRMLAWRQRYRLSLLLASPLCAVLFDLRLELLFASHIELHVGTDWAYRDMQGVG